MEKIKFNKERAFSLIKEGLLYLGFPENLYVESFLLDDDTPFFHVYYEISKNGNIVKNLMPLNKKNAIYLMKFALQLKGYDNPRIDIKVRDEEISYIVSANIVSYDNSRKRRMRK